jgi:hypothetical protein
MFNTQVGPEPLEPLPILKILCDFLGLWLHICHQGQKENDDLPWKEVLLYHSESLGCLSPPDLLLNRVLI